MTFNASRYHKILGLVLLIPLFGWMLTGVVFLVKPGYEAAYEKLSVKTYPIETDINIPANERWLEFKYLKTIIGKHLLVRRDDGWQHLDPETFQVVNFPSADIVNLLLSDAIGENSNRYGNIISINENQARTDTGVHLTLDWQKLSLQQRGRDTRLISWLYRVHYLEWSGNTIFDKFLGGLAIIMLMTLTLLGIKLFLKGDK